MVFCSILNMKTILLYDSNFFFQQIEHLENDDCFQRMQTFY
jgi:hypothetical protein